MVLKFFSFIFVIVFSSLAMAHPEHPLKGYNCDVIENGELTKISLSDPDNEVDLSLKAKSYKLNLYFGSDIPSIVIDLIRDGKSIVSISGQQGSLLVDAVFPEIDLVVSCVGVKFPKESVDEVATDTTKSNWR